MLFSVEMPDRLANPEPGADEPASQETAIPPADSDELLAPVDLPSWVQAMRPVEAAISELRPVLTISPMKGGSTGRASECYPYAPIGSSRRPKAIPLKLQATDEQQSSAALLELILGRDEAMCLVTSTLVPQRMAALDLDGSIPGCVERSHLFPDAVHAVSASLPIGVMHSNAVMNIPANAKVLVVVDYEPSLTGEMEAVGGPLLDQMVLLEPSGSFIHFYFSERFRSRSNDCWPMGKINKPAPDGFGYQAGVQYLNLGYLPGGSARCTRIPGKPGGRLFLPQGLDLCLSMPP